MSESDIVLGYILDNWDDFVFLERELSVHGVMMGGIYWSFKIGIARMNERRFVSRIDSDSESESVSRWLYNVCCTQLILFSWCVSFESVMFWACLVSD